MEKDLLAEMGIEEENEEADSETSDNTNKEEDLGTLREQLETCLLEDDSNSNGESLPTDTQVPVVAVQESKENAVSSSMRDCGSDVEGSVYCETEIHSLSTTSTIPPEVIRDRVKKALDKRSKMANRQRCLAKGEASAVTRQRRENRDTIKDSSGIWGWE